MRIPFGTAVAVWLAVAAALTGCSDSAGGGKGGTGGSGECGGGGGGAGGTCEAKGGTGGGGSSGGGGAVDPCEEPCMEDPGWDVVIGDACFCPDRVCGYSDCDGGWQGVCTDGNWHFSHWDGNDDPSCG